MKTLIVLSSIAIVTVSTLGVRAQTEIPWHTIDGGGHMVSAGGAFELGGTIGQPDASSFSVPMSGGAFQVVGGFWPVAAACSCLGDMNGDSEKDGLDVQYFVGCVMSGGSCSCADVDAANGVNFDDVAVFVDDLLTGDPCP